MKLFKDKTTLELEIKTLRQELARVTQHVKQGQEEILRIAKERDELSNKVSSISYDLIKEKDRAEAISALHRNASKVLNDVNEKLDWYKKTVDSAQIQEYHQFLILGQDSRTNLDKFLNKRLSDGHTVHSITSSVYVEGNCLLHVVLNLPKVKTTTEPLPQP